MPAMSSDFNDLNPESLKPLQNLGELEDDLITRYPAPGSITNLKSTEESRNYNTTKESVRDFYKLNHAFQTFDFVVRKRSALLQFNKAQMSIWNAFDLLNTLEDNCDPDTEPDQMQHLLQTSEAIRANGHPDWMVLVGLFHDLGKVLCLFGEPQWAVIGDTFPVGCAFSKKIVNHEFFRENPDSYDPRFNTLHGIYEPNTGLRNVLMSWGHDEYIFQIMKDYLPEPALYMLRYHSFYAQHRENAYLHLMDGHDIEMFEWVKLFNPYDLYSNNPTPPDWNALRPYYEDLVAKYLPSRLKF
jgi:inositol oxygenase